MKITVTESMFHQQFIALDRGEQFSREGRAALFEYLEDMERDTGEEWELDVIALCCDFAEDSPEDIAAAYSLESHEPEDIRDYLEGEGVFVAELGNGCFLYRQH